MQQPQSNLSLNEEIQKIADKIKGDVEKELNQVFQKFKVTEHQALKNEKEPEKTSYAMKVETDDDSHLKLKTCQKDQFSGWITDVDESFRAISPFENLLRSFDSSRTGFNSIQQLANCIKQDVEKELNKNFQKFDVIEYHPILTDPEHTSYYMRLKTDDNGHVTVKTIKKTPKSDWETHVEEYERGKPSLGDKSKEKLERGQQKEALRSEQRGNQGMEVESGPSKTSSA